MAKHGKAKEEKPRRAARAAHRRDHRAALQANKLRMNLATTAVCFGEEEPVIAPKTLRIVVVSLIIACIMLVVTIAAAKILQML